MITQETNDYYYSWKQKQASNKEDNLSAIFDRFRDLYPTYNRLYNEIPTVLRAAGHSLPNKLLDNVKATEYVVRFIGAQNLLQNFSANDCDSEIEAIDMILIKELFHIKLKDGQSDRASDIQLSADINSGIPEMKAIAILKVIYLIRCNMEHGEKHFVEYQRLLLEPATKLLQTVVEHLYSRLDSPK